MKRDSPRPLATRPRLCFVGYRHIREFAMPVIAQYADRAEIDLVDGTFAGALTLARERVQAGTADAFISAGSNAAILRQGLAAPVATIQLTGFDLLRTLIRAKRSTNRVGIVTYGEVIPELDAAKELLNIEIRQYAYRTPDDARHCFRELRDAGFRVIVGSSLVVELANEYGLTGLLAYSLDSIRRGIEDAIELARVARLEASRYERLNAVLHSLHEAMLAVDGEHRITAVNPPMQQLLGRAQAGLLGRLLEEVEPELSLRAALSSGVEERSVVQRFAGRDWVTHRTPIRELGDTVGAVLMLHDAQNIQAAEAILRIQQRRQQPMARHSFAGLLGESAAMRRAVQTARRYARTDLTVLLSGETGTGKELFAQAIHNESARTAQPFVAVNCASFPETLLESELFGYEEGAFTGARKGGKRGLIEAAHNGTLFLDEIGDMPMPLQSRLLRVLQEREVTRLGSSAAVPVNLRVIAATHQPLERMVQERRFRQDLYYRLNALRLTLPPLRERREDIAPLARAALVRSLKETRAGVSQQGLLEPLLAAMHWYDWPGNVRELENVCARLAALHADSWQDATPGPQVLEEEFPELFPRGSAPARTPAVAGPLADRVAEAMRLSGNNRQQAARRLGVSRSTLWRWLRQVEAEASPLALARSG
jgi:propionate catabolism operon transcriptional regulator